MVNKKLIEVALPLDVINDASAYDKMPGIGPHPKGIHHWWAALPLPAARAILFSSLIDDPSENPFFKNKNDNEIRDERKRLFGIINDFCIKKPHERPDAFKRAIDEIQKSCNGILPTLVDPFCGGGSIPLEAQRLGLPVCASDLNPIAVIKTKAMIEIIPTFLNKPPINPQSVKEKGLLESKWDGIKGLTEDLRYYGKWIQREAEKRIGDLYPKITTENKSELSVIAWLWARTVTCPNPACKSTVPLVRSYWLSNKGNHKTWINPKTSSVSKEMNFEVVNDKGSPPEGTMVRKKGAICPFCNTLLTLDYIRSEGIAKRIGIQLMATVTESKKGRAYHSPDSFSTEIIKKVQPSWVPNYELPHNPRYISPPFYGMLEHSDIYTARQLVALNTLCELVTEAQEKIEKDAMAAGLISDKIRLIDGGCGATAYSDAISTFLAFAIDRCADFNNSLCTWSPSNEKVMHLFGRQAIPMVWDFSEANIIEGSVGGWTTCLNYIADCVESIPIVSKKKGTVAQLDAANTVWDIDNIILSTDPPYYDNIGYADLSDFFYVWLRKSLGPVYPNLFSTILTPKSQELVAIPYRHDGGLVEASEHFESGFIKTFSSLLPKLDKRFPITVFYAFKQDDSETESGESDNHSPSTAWETMLESLLKSGFQVTSTWPIRASQKWRMVSMGTNALASYVVFSCRPRASSAPLATRREFIAELKKSFPDSLKKLQESSIAPVDLVQASIGPGISVFSRYSKVLEADSSSMTIRTALQIINQELEAFFKHEEGEMDNETQLLVDWFEQFGMKSGSFGDAETLSKAKNTSISGLSKLGLLSSKGGLVSIVPRTDYEKDWDPNSEQRLTLWECTQYLIKFHQEEGEDVAAQLASRLGTGKSEDAKNLAYRLYNICERNKWVNEAIPYNELITAWPQIIEKTVNITGKGPQKKLDVV